MEEVWNLLDYPDDDVKAAAIEAISFFLIAYFKSGVGRWFYSYEQCFGSAFIFCECRYGSSCFFNADLDPAYKFGENKNLPCMKSFLEMKNTKKRLLKGK